jgi:O-antigen/teichoic acid export membrane protein
MHFNTILKHTIAWKMINTVLVFLINLLLVRLLGVAASGSFFYAITELSLLVLLLSWCLESGITYFASKDDHLISTILFFILPLLLVQGAIAFVVLKSMQLTISYQLALLFIVSSLAIIYFSAFFYAKKWFIALNIIICGVNFITALGLLFLWYRNEESTSKTEVYQLVYIVGISLLAAILVVSIIVSTKKITPPATAVLPVVKEMFTYSSVAFLSNTLFFFVIRVDYFFVQQYCSPAALSNYIQVSKFGQLLILVPSIIGSLVFPYSAGSGDAMGVNKVQQLCRVITLIFLPVTLVIFLTGYWVLPWVFGDGFNLMYVALLLYLPGFFALSIVTVLAAHLGGRRMLKANLLAASLALVMVVTGDVLTIPAYGINAAAAASSIGYIVCCIYLVWLFKVKFNCNAKGFFIIQKQEIKYIATQFKKFILPSTYKIT